MKQNRFNQLTRYEDIFARFSKIQNQYLKLYGTNKLYKFILKQQKVIDSGFENHLIENDFTPDELASEIKNSYLSRDYLEGEIGLIDGQDQYDGIFNIALYMFMSNRLGKIYKNELDKNSSLDKNAQDLFKNKYKNLMLEKDSATAKLIYSLFIYKETENNNDFFYGYRTDDYGDSTFVIDLPVYGQISVHFGSEESLENIKYIARQNINQILEKKLELGQITAEQFSEIESKADNEGILPEYTGKLYEYSSSMPLDYCGEKFEMAQKDLKLDGKMISDITDEDIKTISENKKYNSRELYYFAIKSDFSKSQLEKLSKYLQERDKITVKHNTTDKSKFINVASIGKTSIKATSAEERKAVAEHENMYNSINLNNSKEK